MTHRATWSLSLDTECPACGEYFDMLCTPDFWEDSMGLEICEHGTERSEGFGTHCPKCDHEFEVDLEY
jgi:hypothetical protein